MSAVDTLSARTFFKSGVVTLAARHAVPAIYGLREFAASGGLMSYGNDLADAYHQSGIYAAKILKGAKPRRLTGPTSGKNGVRHQPENRQDTRPYLPDHILGRTDEVIE